MKRLLLITLVLMLSSSIALAQDFCMEDYDYAGDCDGAAVASFLQNFGRPWITPYQWACTCAQDRIEQHHTTSMFSSS